MKNLYLKSIFILTFAAVVSVQFLFDQPKTKVIPSDPIVFSSKTIKYFDLGLHNAAADLAWINTIQYYGDPKYKNYDKLVDYLNITVELDPHFTYPYAFGTLILPSIKKTDKAISLGEKGIKNAPDSWQIPHYLGTTYHIHKKDYPTAAKYFTLAAASKNAPDSIKKLALSYGQTRNLNNQTQIIWENIYRTSTDEVVKERAKNNILHFEIISLLENSAIKYKQKIGSYPKELSDLVLANILKTIPSDPLGYTLYFDKDGKIRVK